MLRVNCSVQCGNESQFEFSDTDNGFVCNVCGQPAIPIESNELEQMYPQWYLEAEFMLQ